MQFSLSPVRLVLALLGALILAAPATAQRRGKKSAKLPDITFFVGDLDAARKEARERNTPVLILAALDGEEGSGRFHDIVMGVNGNKRENMNRAAAGTLVVLVNNGTHDTKKVMRKDANGDAMEVEVCGSWETKSCDVHQKNWDDVYLEFTADEDGEGGQWALPELILLTPLGELAWRGSGDPMSLDDLEGVVSEARRSAGPSLTKAELITVKKHIEAGRTMMRAKSWHDAWHAWAGILAITEKSVYAQEALREQPKALEEMGKDLDKLVAQLVPATARSAYLQMVDLQKGFAGSPLEARMKVELKKAEKNKSLKAIIATVKLELQAEAMFDKAMTLFDDGKDKQAQKELRKILSKKFSGTPAAQRVRERFPELVKS